MRLDGVLDRERRQVELERNVGDVLDRGLLQPDPDEARRLPGRVPGLIERQPTWSAMPVLIDGAVADDVIETPLGLCRIRRGHRSGLAGVSPAPSGSLR